MLKRIFIFTAVLVFFLAAQTPASYTGTWASGSSGGNGKLNLAFTDAGLATASFTLQGQEIKTKAISSKTEGNVFEFVFEYDLDGNLLRSRMRGTLEGKSMKGKYQSAPAGGGDPVDEGTWEVTQR